MANALKVVGFLKNHPNVKKVNHPALADHPNYDLDQRYFPNGAGVKSLVIHPASTTHSQLNAEELTEQEIYPGTIRLSVGTEHIDDLIADLEQALAKI